MTRTVLPCRVPLYTHNVKYNRVKIVFSFQRLFFFFSFVRVGIEAKEDSDSYERFWQGSDYFLESSEIGGEEADRDKSQEKTPKEKRQKANTLSLTSRERDRERVYKEIHKWNKIQQYTTNSLYSGGHSAISSGDHYRLAPSVVRVFCFDKRDDGRNKRTRRRTFAQLFSFPFSPPFFLSFVHRGVGARRLPSIRETLKIQNSEWQRWRLLEIKAKV